MFDYSSDRLERRVREAERIAARAVADAAEAIAFTRSTMREHCKELQALNDLWQHYDAEKRAWTR